MKLKFLLLTGTLLRQSNNLISKVLTLPRVFFLIKNMANAIIVLQIDAIV